MMNISKISKNNYVEKYNRYWMPIDDSMLYGTPLIYKKSKGMRVWIEGHGRPFNDLVLGYGAINFGHNPAFLVTAIKRLAGEVHHIHSIPNIYSLDLCEYLQKILNHIGRYKMHFPVGGSEAVSDAIKLSLVITGRRKIVRCDGSFHGFGYIPLKVTDSSFANTHNILIDKDEDIIKIPYCDPYKCANNKDGNCQYECKEKVHNIIDAEKDKIACIIVEPIQGANGFIIPKYGYCELIEEICRKNNVILIIDEIQVGVARTGNFFAFQESGFKEPDMITLGKSLAGGYFPLSAVIVKEDIFHEIKSPGPFGSTFSHSPFGSSLAISVLDYIYNNNLLPRIKKMGNFMLNLLKESLSYPFISNLRGKGLCIAFDITLGMNKEKNMQIARTFLQLGLDEFILLYLCGKNRNSIKIFPILQTNKDEVIMVVEKLEKICKNIAVQIS